MARENHVAIPSYATIPSRIWKCFLGDRKTQQRLPAYICLATGDVPVGKVADEVPTIADPIVPIYVALKRVARTMRVQAEDLGPEPDRPPVKVHPGDEDVVVSKISNCRVGLEDAALRRLAGRAFRHRFRLRARRSAAGRAPHAMSARRGGEMQVPAKVRSSGLVTWRLRSATRCARSSISMSTHVAKIGQGLSRAMSREALHAPPDRGGRSDGVDTRRSKGGGVSGGCSIRGRPRDAVPAVRGAGATM